MSKQKKKTFYWITWEVNTVCYWNLASLHYVTKWKILSKNWDVKTSFRPFCYSVKFVLCFMFGIWWRHDIWISGKLKWLSQERKERSKWNKKHFSLFHKCSASLRLEKQTNKNVAVTTFNRLSKEVFILFKQHPCLVILKPVRVQ